MTCDDPPGRLLQHLTELDLRQDLLSQAAIFEALFWRCEIGHFWNYFRMRQVYADLGRRDMAFLMACLAVRCERPDGPLWPSYRELFVTLKDRGDDRAAVAAFLANAAVTPHQPVADRWEIEPMTRALGLSLDGPPATPSPGARRNHMVYPAEPRTPCLPAVLPAGRLPGELAKLGRADQRGAVVVAELADAELLILHDHVVTVDREGFTHIDLSLGPFPKLVRDRVEADLFAETLTLEQAVVVVDRHPPPNLCHFLLDHVARLAVFAAAGVDLSTATVVGPALTAPFQTEIFARAGVGAWLGTNRVARARVRRLFVSSEMRELQHPAHLCAPWAIDFVRALLGAAAAPGHRKLYVSRADSRTRQVVNEADLRPLLAARGFEVIVPGTMPYAAQLAAFRAASHVVGVHGAGLTHIAVCFPGTRVLEMFHPLYGNWEYAMLSQACGLAYTALVGRDGVSDAPELNDPGVARPDGGQHGDRSIRVDPALLTAWLDAP